MLAARHLLRRVRCEARTRNPFITRRARGSDVARRGRFAGKSIIAIFLSEVLDLLLRRSEPDEALSDFLFSSIEAFAAITDNSCTASFHIIFLYHLTLYAGIGPDADTYIPGCVFDLREGMFRTTAPLHPDFIAGEECSYFASLASARYDTPLHIPAPIRRHLLDFLLTYYSLHLMSFSSLKSLEILRDMA